MVFQLSGGNTRHVAYGTPAQTIQATSYALMAFLNEKKDRRYLDSYVAWLNKQMQPSGALRSTQVSKLYFPNSPQTTATISVSNITSLDVAAAACYRCGSSPCTSLAMKQNSEEMLEGAANGHPLAEMEALIDE